MKGSKWGGSGEEKVTSDQTMTGWTRVEKKYFRGKCVGISDWPNKVRKGYLGKNPLEKGRSHPAEVTCHQSGNQGAMRPPSRSVWLELFGILGTISIRECQMPPTAPELSTWPRAEWPPLEPLRPRDAGTQCPSLKSLAANPCPKRNISLSGTWRYVILGVH